MVIAIVAAVLELAAWGWLGVWQVRLCNLVERQQEKLRHNAAKLKVAQYELEQTREKLYIAETERDFYKAANKKPRLEDSVREMESC